jgi:DNA topoisomerase I
LSKYTLIVTEKPDAASRIALALDAAGKPKRMRESGVPYYEAQRDRKIVVVPAFGHLYTVAADATDRKSYPLLKYTWVPRYQTERGASRVRVWLRAITKLSKDADIFIDACDFDIEGSIIGYCILKYACGDKENEAKRMKYSTLTKEELEKSYETLLPHLDFGLIEAGLARHEIDWLYGINLSRALTTASKKYSKQYTTLSTGRVQGPTLKFLAARERSISRFVPLPFWTLKVKVKVGDAPFWAEYAKKVIETKEEAEIIVKQCKGKTGAVENVDTKSVIQAPPAPFDLGVLQSEAYRFFGYTPMHTSSIAQRLYLDALISYPRTSSQKLPQDIGYQKIFRNLAKNPDLARVAAKFLSRGVLKPVEGKKQDSAHPAIYPTGKLPEENLVAAERNVYNLIARRFMATFDDSAALQTVKASVDVCGEKFFLSGRRTLKKGWLELYEPFTRLQDSPLPQIASGDNVLVQRIIAEERFTKPPSRYNPASLLRKMEQGKIGTKATRAGIMQTLYDRKYIREERIVATDLGIEVTDVLRKYSPSVVSVEFTRLLEEKMNLVQQGQETKAKILADAIESLKSIMTSLKENEKAVGEQLSRAVMQAKLEEKTIGPCPACQGGKLIIQHSKKTGKRFVGCTNYFNGTCKITFLLPQKGTAKPSGKKCLGCGWPTVTVWWRGKRSWNLCFNQKCPSKKDARV